MLRAAMWPLTSEQPPCATTNVASHFSKFLQTLSSVL